MSRYLARVRLPRAWWGYRVRDVDLLIGRIRRALVRIELGEEGRITIQQVKGAAFGMRFFGYRHGPVDELLDQVVSRLEEVHRTVPLRQQLLPAAKVRKQKFSRRLRGYRSREVLGLCAKLANVLAEWENGEHSVGLVAADLVSVRFGGSWFGFDRDEVDEFLDEAALTLQTWHQRKPGRR